MIEFFLFNLGKYIEQRINEIKFVTIGKICGLDVLVRNKNTGIINMHKTTKYLL